MNRWLYDHAPGFWLLRDPAKVTLVLVLRGMSRRYRERPGIHESDVPYGPSGITVAADREEVGAR